MNVALGKQASRYRGSKKKSSRKKGKLQKTACRAETVCVKKRRDS
ncbi:hypothetical protein [Brevibacillus gelatini]|nr:hypothetical protein [Brevibacillus gelatini]